MAIRVTRERVRELDRELTNVSLVTEHLLRQQERGESWSRPLFVAISKLRLLQQHVRLMRYAEGRDEPALLLDGRDLEDRSAHAQLGRPGRA